MLADSFTRWRLDIAYDGSDFSGWATQLGQRTVQGDLELWIARVLRLERPARLHCAGRTDAGVHARGQVAHLDLPTALITDGGAELARRLGRALPSDVVVRHVSVAPHGFHARFAAAWRRYVYRLADASTPADPLIRHQLTRTVLAVDLEAFNSAAQTLLGLHEFGAFCRRRDGATTIRTLLELQAVRRTAEPLSGVIEVTVRADAFCHSMVRSLVGALLEVATDQQDLSWLAGFADTSVRESTVPVLPARGLTLEEVGYPDDDGLVARALESRVMRTRP